MIISCVQNENQRNVLTLLIDEEPWHEIHTSIFGKNPRFYRNCQNLADLKEMLLKAEYQGALQYAMRRLAMKSQPVAELQKQLDQKLVSQATSKRVIAECQRLGYLNDSDWLEHFTKKMPLAMWVLMPS